MSSMATIHITRAEAIRDIERLLDQAAGGADILVESETGGPVLIQGSSLSMDPNDPDFEAWLLAEEAEGLRAARDFAGHKTTRQTEDYVRNRKFIRTKPTR